MRRALFLLSLLTLRTCDEGTEPGEDGSSPRLDSGPPIDRDRAGTTRPAGGAQDVGAIERP